MRISIKYKSIWGNSFIDDENKDLRNYIASSSNLKNKSNYKEKEISINTVYGLIYRLVGARSSLSYLLKNDKSLVKELIEKNAFSFENKKKSSTKEIVFLRNNNKKNYLRDGFSGVVDETIIEYGLYEIFDVFLYNREEYLDYLLLDKRTKKDSKNLGIVKISKIIDKLSKDNSLKIKKGDEKYDEIVKKYNYLFEMSKESKASEIMNIAIVAINKAVSDFANKKNDEKINKYLTTSKTLTGLSLTGGSFTIKNFFDNFAGKKIVYGNPYSHKDNDDIRLNKYDGELCINIDCDLETAKELKEAIENAGVSSFYLGKKGLAYINKIII